jgi:hypothetical protein
MQRDRRDASQERTRCFAEDARAACTKSGGSIKIELDHRQKLYSEKLMRAFNLLILPVVLLLSSQAIAQTAYPDRPIKMIVPLAAASAVDVAARIVTQKMADNMGQQFVILNLPEHRAFSYTRAGRQYSPSRAKTAAGPVSK